MGYRLGRREVTQVRGTAVGEGRGRQAGEASRPRPGAVRISPGLPCSSPAAAPGGEPRAGDNRMAPGSVDHYSSDEARRPTKLWPPSSLDVPSLDPLEWTPSGE